MWTYYFFISLYIYICIRFWPYQDALRELMECNPCKITRGLTFKHNKSQPTVCLLLKKWAKGAFGFSIFFDRRIKVSYIHCISFWQAEEWPVSQCSMQNAMDWQGWTFTAYPNCNGLTSMKIHRLSQLQWIDKDELPQPIPNAMDWQGWTPTALDWQAWRSTDYPNCNGLTRMNFHSLSQMQWIDKDELPQPIPNAMDWQGWTSTALDWQGWRFTAYPNCKDWQAWRSPDYPNCNGLTRMNFYSLSQMLWVDMDELPQPIPNAMDC